VSQDDVLFGYRCICSTPPPATLASEACRILWDTQFVTVRRGCPGPFGTSDRIRRRESNTDLGVCSRAIVTGRGTRVGLASNAFARSTFASVVKAHARWWRSVNAEFAAGRFRPIAVALQEA
jgi:hypothetical protein